MKTPLLDLFLPRTCIVCGRTLLLQEREICIYCLSDLPLTYNWLLTHHPMADRFNAIIQRDLPSPEDAFLRKCSADSFRKPLT